MNLLLLNNDETFKQTTTDQEKVNRSCQGSLFEYRSDILESGHNGDSILSEMSLFYRDHMRGLQHDQQNKYNSGQSDIKVIIEDPKDSGCRMVKQQCNNENSKEQEESYKDNESTGKKSIIKRPKSSKDGANTNTAIIQSSKLQVDRQSEVNSYTGNDSQLSIKFNTVRGLGEKEKVSKLQVEQIGTIDKITKEKIHTIDENAIFEQKPLNLKKRLSMALKAQEATSNSQQNKNTPNFEKATNIINKLLNNSMNRMMRVQQHMKNLVQTLKFRRSNKDCSMLSTREYEIINDLSIFHLKHKKKKSSNWFVYKANILLKLSSKVPIFMPTDSMRVSWDIFQVIFTYIFLYIFSILLFFAQDESDLGFIQKFSLYAFFFFLADILINFNTAYFDKDIVVSSRKQIAISYMFSLLFLTDCTSLFVLGAKIASQSNSLAYNPDNNFWTYGFNILIFLKSNGMQPKRKRFDYVFTLRESQKHIIKLINQIISVITVAHIASIGWYFLGIQEERNEFEMSWLKKANLTSSTYSQKYIYSIYWAITTMTTVGYGDIAATNDIEALFIALNMIVFSCVFAYSINNIGFILQEIEKSSKQLNDNITTIQRYLNRKNVNISLKSRVRHYLSFLAQEQKDRNKQAEDSILNLLSNKLRDEIMNEINTKILNSYHVFSSNFSIQTLRKLVFVMKEVLVSPNEIIFRDDDGDDQSIYFIQSGIIEIFHNSVCKNNQQAITQQLEANQIFGEISFFSGLARKASARSVNLSTLYKITREDFIEVLNTNQEDFERFKMIQEQIIFQKEYNSLFVECYTCKTIGHIAKFCPMTHQDFDRQFIVLKNNYSLFQDRNITQVSRKAYSLRCSLQYVHSNKTVCQQLKDNLQELNSEIFLMFKTEEDILETESIDNSEFKENEQTDSFSSSSSSLSQDSSQTPSQIFHKEKKERRKPQNKSMSSPKEGQSDVFSQQNLVTPSFKQKARKSRSLGGQEKPTKQHATEKSKRHKQKLRKSLSETGKNNQNQTSLSSCDGTYVSQESSIQKITGLSLKAASLKAVENKADSGSNRNIRPKLNKNQEIKQNIEQKPSSICKVISDKSMSSNSEEPSPLDQQSAKLLKHIQMSLEQQSREIKQQQLLQAQEFYQLFHQTMPKNSSKKIEENYMEMPSKNMEIPSSNSYQVNKRLSQANEHQLSSFQNGSQLSQKKNQYRESNEIRQSIDNLLLQGLIAQGMIVSQSSYLKDPASVQHFSSTSLFPNTKYQELQEKQLNRNSALILEKLNENNLTNLKSKQRLEVEEERKSSQKISSLVTPLSNQQFEQEKTNNFQNFQNQHKNSQQQDQMMERISNLLGIPNEYVNLLQHVSAGLSFREMPSMSQNQMDFFDQMRIFKKFFPNNNFDKVVIKLKTKLIEQKKLKKQKIGLKSRRLNIVFLPNQTHNSFFGNTELRPILQEPNYESYRPTYLSYGIGMRKGMLYPIRHDPLSSAIN